MRSSGAFGWIYLVGAGFCEMAWMYSLKYISWDALKTVQWSALHRPDANRLALLALVAYVVFGIVNTILLAAAMRTIPTTTAFTVWMALTLVFLKAADVFWLKMSWSWSELFFILLMAVGIIGLKAVGSTD